jgi:hypothetical protein
MRFIGLLLALALIGYLAYTQLGAGQTGATTVKESSSSMRKDGLPPTTKTTGAGIAIERARQVKGLNEQRTQGVEGVLESGLGR